MLATLLVVLIGLQPSAALAQQASQAQPPPSTLQTLPPLPTNPPAATPKDPTNVEALGVSFDRIKQILGDKKPTDDKNGMKLNFFVEVVAEAPPIQIFTKQDVAPVGPVPFGAPTHADIVDQLTPVEFKSGVIPVSALAIMGITKLIEWEANRVKREKAEEDRKKRDEEERKRQQQVQDSSLIVIKK